MIMYEDEIRAILSKYMDDIPLELVAEIDDLVYDREEAASESAMVWADENSGCDC